MINYFYLQTICSKIRGDFVFLQVSVEKQNGTSNKYNCVIDWTREITENIGKTKFPSKLQCYCLLSGIVFYLLRWRIGSLKFSPVIVTRWMGLYVFFAGSGEDLRIMSHSRLGEVLAILKNILHKYPALQSSELFSASAGLISKIKSMCLVLWVKFIFS